MSELEKIQLLRRLLPVPLLEAKQLLEVHQGDIKTAVEQWKQALVSRLIEETGISHERGIAILAKHGYDYEKSYLEAIRETKDLIELTLNSTQDLWTVLYHIARVIEQQYHIADYEYYSAPALEGLPKREYEFYIIWKWINFIQLESKDAVKQTPEEIIRVLQQLSLPDYVQIIRKLQGGSIALETVDKEFIVESEIGEALLKLMKEKGVKTA